MSQKQLHDLLVELEQERKNLDIVGQEQNHRLDELIEALEQQAIYPDSFDQYSALNLQIEDLRAAYEAEYPKVAAALASISQVLQNFRT